MWAWGSVVLSFALVTLPMDSVEARGPRIRRLEQAIGSPANGRLRNATALPAEGAGYIKLFRSRHRQWGTSELVRLVESVAARMSEESPGCDRFQVGDLSARQGGRITRHSSHQNGVDADIAFLRRDCREQEPEDSRGFDESFVENGEVTANFDLDRNFRALQLLVGSGRVTRIFVNPVIKRALCEFAKREGMLEENVEVLRRLRPWAGHDEHLHVRIACPASSPRCRDQAEVPPGSGCPGEEI